MEMHQSGFSHSQYNGFMHLDGVYQAVHALQSHYVEDRYEIKPEFDAKVTEFCEGDQAEFKCRFNYGTRRHDRKDFIHTEVLARLSMIQIACITVDMALTEALRGAILITGGILTLNSDPIVQGLIDLVSVVVQSIVLPIMGIVSIFHPVSAMKLGDYALEYAAKKEWVPENLGDYEKFVFGSLLGITQIPISSVRSALRIPVGIVDGDFWSTVSAIVCTVGEPFASFERLFSEDCKSKHTEFSGRAFLNIGQRFLNLLKMCESCCEL